MAEKTIIEREENSRAPTQLLADCVFKRSARECLCCSQTRRHGNDLVPDACIANTNSQNEFGLGPSKLFGVNAGTYFFFERCAVAQR